jgi:uncharacterized protein YeaO (DUF488 family)
VTDHGEADRITEACCTSSGLRIKRVHDSPDPDDGCRVLVDRLWRRGITKARAAIDLWC